ncbi:MAG: DUF4127 family protein [Candidatus Obscuribacterales bacterium]|nr:DUF4127 family protein [Candidatus Obscuribacterales bacterium]
MKLALIPIDNRPVTYHYPQLVAQVAGIEPLVPPRELLGSLNEPAKIDEIYSWLDTTIKNEKPEALIICLDTLLHGGLITSRRSEETLDQILARLNKLIELGNGTKLSILAQSSIMRISDNYDNTEEKTYWKEFGRELFAWSSELHKAELEKEASKNVALLESKIPNDIRQDYLATRKRNHAINLQLVEQTEKGLFSSLIFSQDDSGEFGLNVSEKQQLQTLSQEKNLANSIFAYAGADEVICTLISRFLASKLPTPPKALVRFSTSGVVNCKSRYEGQTIGESVTNQLNAAGISRVSGAADFFVIVHGNEDEQGDHITLPNLADKSHLNTARSVKQTLDYIATSQYPCVICDVAYANGADPMLIAELLERPDLLKKLWAYGAWNTSGNTIGSVLATAAARHYAKASEAQTEEFAQKALFVRLMDDWAYQTQVRPQLKGQASADKLEKLMRPYAKQLAKALEYEPGELKFTFPWQRTFEVEVSS